MFGYTPTLDPRQNGVGDHRHALAALPAGKNTGTHGYASGPVWMGSKNLAPHRGSNPRPSSL